MSGIIVDLFAGGGGASLGIEMALGRAPDIAINHDPIALGVHERNHPITRHLHGDVWHYAPREVVGDRPVDLLWLSPTCTHFSRAKGAPLDRRQASRVRALAWVGARWARDLPPKQRPRLILCENVEAFRGWGPLDENGRVRDGKQGFTFRRWIRTIEGAGYRSSYRELRACDYGAPTTRNRIFVGFSLDGEIDWPDATHGDGLLPYRSAAECIDWTIPAPSIFGRGLATPTLRRIARGIRKHVLEAAEPFIIPVSHGGDARVQPIGGPLRTVTASSRSPFAVVVPSLIHLSNGERPGQAPRIYDPQDPLSTVVAQGVKHGLVTAFLVKHFGGHEGSGLPLPNQVGTVTTRDHHALVTCLLGDRRVEVRDFLREHGGAPDGDLVRIGGEVYAIADIGMRGLVPRELARAQGFPDSYVLEQTADGRPTTKTKQIALVGNSVSPVVAEALVRANFRGAAGRVAA